MAINVGEAIGLGDFKLGFGSTFLNVILLIAIICVILLLVAGILILWINAKKYKFRIPLYAIVGNVPTRVAIVKAKPVKFGRAGDVLWYCKGKGIKKWIAPPTIQSHANEFWHFIRKDGEWINFSMDDFDEKSKKMGVKFVAQDMRMQRLANEKLIELKFSGKGFWEKWGVIIGYVIFFLVITVSLVIYFYQLNGAMQSMSEVVGKVNDLLDKANRIEGGRSPDAADSLIPAMIPIMLLIRRKKRGWEKAKCQEEFMGKGRNVRNVECISIA